MVFDSCFGGRNLLESMDVDEEQCEDERTRQWLDRATVHDEIMKREEQIEELQEQLRVMTRAQKHSEGMYERLRSNVIEYEKAGSCEELEVVFAAWGIHMNRMNGQLESEIMKENEKLKRDSSIKTKALTEYKGELLVAKSDVEDLQILRDRLQAEVVSCKNRIDSMVAKNKKKATDEEAAGRLARQLEFVCAENTELQKRLRSKEEEIDRLQMEEASLQKELKAANWEVAVAKNNAEKAKGSCQKKVHGLEEQLETCKSELRNARTELKAVSAQAQDAICTKTRLFQMLQLSTVKRSDRAPKGAFPDGETIEKIVRVCQEDTLFYFFDLTLFMDRNADRREYENIFDSVLVPCSDHVEDLTQKFLEDKNRHLTDFMEVDVRESNHPEHSLLALFMKSTMQKVAKARMDSEDTETVLDSIDVEKHPLLVWASTEQVRNHEDMEDRHLGTFAKALFDLRLVCQFSEPALYLWPKIGVATQFSPSQHSQKYLPCFKKKARKGDTVRVLHPGLYAVDPEESPNLPPPIVKPLVIMFDKINSTLANRSRSFVATKRGRISFDESIA